MQLAATVQNTSEFIVKTVERGLLKRTEVPAIEIISKIN